MTHCGRKKRPPVSIRRDGDNEGNVDVGDDDADGDDGSIIFQQENNTQCF